MATDVTKLVLAVDSRQIKQGTKEAKRLERSGKDAEGSFRSASAAIKGMIGVVSTLAVTFAIKEIALASARYETLGIVMRVVGNNAGYTGQQMTEFEETLKDSGIAAIESRTVLTKMAQAQIDLAKSSKLARIAQDAAVIGNINSSEALERMITGIQSGQVEILRNIGINVSFEQSYKKLAAQLDTNSASLTENQKMQARANIVMEAGAQIAGTYSAAMESTGKKLTSLPRYFNDLKVAAGAAIDPILGEVVDGLTDSLKDLSAWFEDDLNKKAVRGWGNTALEVFEAIEIEAIRTGMLLDKIGGSMTFLASLPSAIPAALGVKSSEERMQRMADLNIMFEQRYLEKDKMLEDLATKQIEREAALTPQAVKAREAILKETEAKRIAAAEQRKVDEEQEASRAKAEIAAKKLVGSWSKVSSALAKQQELSGLNGLEKSLVEIEQKARELRAQFGPEYKDRIDSWSGAMKNMAQSEYDTALATERRVEAQKTAAAIADTNAAAADRVASAMDELSLASMTGEQREVAMIERQYERLQNMARELAMLGEISEAAADQMQQALGVQMSEALDKLGEKGGDIASKLTDAFAGWANSHVKTLNDMLWSSEVTFDGILESFGKMVTEMLIQSAMLQLVGGGESGGGSGSSGLIGTAVNSIDWGALFSADGGGYTGGGARSGGVDGKGGFPAILHPQETITDHTKGQSKAPEVNTKIINVLDPSIMGDYLGSTDGEQLVMNIIQKNGVS